MTAVKAGEVEGLLRRGPDPRIAVILVYGPDTGLVAERARLLAEKAVDDPADPFALVKLDGDVLAGDPGRLVDEAATVGLFGGKRAVWVRPGSRNYAPAVEAALKQEGTDTRIVVEAGDLAKSAPLRVVCERSPRALAIPCYADDAGTLADLIDRTLRADNLRITRDARDLLAAGLGGDRRASLGEIEKLALYARGQGEIGIEDVEAIGSDVSGSMLNTLVDAAFAGRIAETEHSYRRFQIEGMDASVMLGAALRHALTLLATRLDGEGKSPGAMVSGWRGLHFRRQRIVETQLARWSPASLRRAVTLLQDAVLGARRAGGDFSHAIAADLFLRLASEAARRG
ncbi:DNA polymerase III subunit delta [Methylobacterium ajmalii]|uniref:DNA polymerase III subunit delta n=1 Tax=Methylobacterium ajmalii TaxID=2738439 RepID=UPI00190DFC64|nr:DNA polymerase III subunit delta [Methylobacterium ajmalii]MBK3400265.1 DNA polymerase III subunit delta [Methylobacterium ajmalii]MBK3411879.1 DNA polymerase III subunit delta [Methylobacterium ajmalii]MBK3422700.1 DNA polymerase III subunit delta [Methylobacterium ajmalii]MBZ6411654.1 DNA polymerase III subunit delta [Methylobacterium sp.]